MNPLFENSSPPHCVQSRGFFESDPTVNDDRPSLRYPVLRKDGLPSPAPRSSKAEDILHHRKRRKILLRKPPLLTRRRTKPDDFPYLTQSVLVGKFNLALERYKVRDIFPLQAGVVTLYKIVRACMIVSDSLRSRDKALCSLLKSHGITSW